MSCEKDNLESPDIKIEFDNDVTPALVSFSVEDNWDRYQWKINETYPDPPFTNELKFVIGNQDTSTVNLIVYKGERSIEVSKTFISPPRPKSLTLKGIIIDNIDSDMVFPETYKVCLGVYDDNSWEYDSTVFSINNEYQVDDYFLFEKEFKVNLTNLKGDSIPKISLCIKSEKAINEVCVYDYFTESKGFFLLPDPYFPEKAFFSAREINDEGRLSFIADWKP